MSDTGWVSPGTVVSDDAVGTLAWSDPSNATVSNDTYAVSTASSFEDPPGDYLVKLVDEMGTVLGDNNASNNFLNTTDTYRSYGSSSDLWGHTWSATDINDSDFGIVFQVGFFNYLESEFYYSEYLKATNFGFGIPSGATIDGIEVRVEQKRGTDLESNRLAQIDHIQIKVYYTVSGTEANSERGLYIKGGKHYSRESDNTLGTDDSNLATIFSEQDYTAVGTDNDTYVDLEGTEQYFEFLFKEPNDNSTDSFRITWKGKSSVAPSSYPVYLQIYNRTTASWTTLTSNNSASANTKLTLTSDILTSMSDYYDANHVISARVYQDIT